MSRELSDLDLQDMFEETEASQEFEIDSEEYYEALNDYINFLEERGVITSMDGAIYLL